MSAWPPIEDLIWLFETDPIVEYEDLAQPVAATTFISRRGDTSIECTVEPYMNSLSVRCEERGQERFHLQLWGIIDEIHVDSLHGREALVASIADGLPFHRLRLEMKPAPRLTWERVAPWAPGIASQRSTDLLISSAHCSARRRWAAAARSGHYAFVALLEQRSLAEIAEFSDSQQLKVIVHTDAWVPSADEQRRTAKHRPPRTP